MSKKQPDNYGCVEYVKGPKFPDIVDVDKMHAHVCCCCCVGVLRPFETFQVIPGAVS